ncbi:MAG: SRPBCC domain-containing protein [Acidimicrobiia bacterium]
MEHVEREIRLPSSSEEVWRAVVDPARLGGWLGGELDIVARPGARGSFRSADGAARRVIVLAVDNGHQLSFAWWPETAAGSSSTVTITVTGDVDGGSVVRVRETRAQAMLATA